jgi:hypothetical protein
MKGSWKTLLLALCALAWLGGGGAAAQSLARFVPAAPTRSKPAALELRFVRERSGHVEPQVWPMSELGWLFVREEGTQRNYDTLAPAPEDARILRVERGAKGVALVGWDVRPELERTSAVTLRGFLADRGGSRVSTETLEKMPAEQELSLRRLESLTLLAREVEAGAAPEPSAVATSKSGQRMELRALFDPTFVTAGSECAFRLSLPEGGEAGLWVRAVHLASGTVLPVDVLPERSLRCKLDRAGPWMIEAHRLRELAPGSGAELELASTTLVFDVRPAEEPNKEGDGR